MMKKAFLFCLILVCVFTVFAENIKMPPFAIPTARSSGMGGAHTAYTDNVFALLVNPAAIMRVRQKSYFAVSSALLSPQSTFGLIRPIQDAIGGNMSALGNAADVISKRGDGNVPLGFDVRELPLSIAWVADGFGYGVWSRVFVNPNIIGTYVDLNVYGDVIMPVGVAVKILETDSHAIDMGLTAKPFVRVLAQERASITDLMEDSNKFADSISVPVLAGVGFDVGFMYRWDIGLNAGFTISDVASWGRSVAVIRGNKDTNDYYVPLAFNLGVAYDFKIGHFWTSAPRFLANTGLTFAFDWHDIGNAFNQNDYLDHRNALLDISAGVQLSFYDKYMLRFGMNEMLPAVGLGVNLGPMEIDLAYYGRELGYEPGMLSVPMLDLTIAYRPKAKPRNWFWTKRSIVGAIARSDKF